MSNAVSSNVGGFRPPFVRVREGEVIKYSVVEGEEIKYSLIEGEEGVIKYSVIEGEGGAGGVLIINFA